MRKVVFEDLSRRLHFEPKILKKRISARQLRRLYRLKLALVVVRDEVSPLCFAGLWPTRDRTWFELGTMWIHPGLRGRGLAGTVFDKVMKLLPPGKRVFLVARNMKVVHLALDRGWVEDPAWRTNSQWSGICRSWGYGAEAQSSARMPNHGRLLFK
jgi:hypothetical protein